VQYARFIGNIASLRLGDSLRYREPALALVRERLPATLLLALGALVISIGVGVPLGMVAAIRPHTVWDHGSSLLATMGQTVPAFWLGILLILAFPLRLGWFFTSGYGTVQHLVLPAITLGAFHTARLARLVRGGMLDVLGHDYVRTARAKGLDDRVVLYRHALRNAMLTIVTVVGLQLPRLVAGAAITETVFAWPGMGSLAVRAAFERDYPMIMGITLVISAVVAASSLVIDVAYVYLDPRIRYG
jgi:peptide/nickel transport system permease protein